MPTILSVETKAAPLCNGPAHPAGLASLTRGALLFVAVGASLYGKSTLLLLRF